MDRSELTVEYILQLYNKEGLRQCEIAKKTGLPQYHISSIVNKKIHHIPKKQKRGIVSDEMRQQIREDCLNGATLVSIREKYDISASTISRLCSDIPRFNADGSPCEHKPQDINSSVFTNSKPQDNSSFVCDISYKSTHRKSRGKIVTKKGVIKDIERRSVTFLDLSNPYCTDEYKQILKDWDGKTLLSYYCGINNVPYERLLAKITGNYLVNIDGNMPKMPDCKVRRMSASQLREGKTIKEMFNKRK